MTCGIYRPDEKKLKEYWIAGIEVSINDDAKSHQICTETQFLSMPEKYCEIS